MVTWNICPYSADKALLDWRPALSDVSHGLQKHVFCVQADTDARAVHARLHVYVSSQEFRKAPEGRVMPAYDASRYDRA